MQDATIHVDKENMSGARKRGSGHLEVDGPAHNDTLASASRKAAKAPAQESSGIPSLTQFIEEQALHLHDEVRWHVDRYHCLVLGHSIMPRARLKRCHTLKVHWVFIFLFLYPV